MNKDVNLSQQRSDVLAMPKKYKTKTASEAFNDAQKMLQKYIRIVRTRDGWSPSFPRKTSKKTRYRL